MKYLLMDVGNTLIKIATVNNDMKINTWPVIPTKAKNIKLLLKQTFISYQQELVITNVIISCVVPELLVFIKQLIIKIYYIEPLIVNSDLIKPLPVSINFENSQLGSDLIALLVGANYQKYENVIVVSLGTATTYSIIVNNVLIGVIIAPGLASSKAALINNAALLTDFDINYYDSMLGKNTNHALAIGYGYGFNAMIKGMVAKINSEINLMLPVVLTGGSFNILEPYFDFKYQYEPQTLLWGLWVMAQN